MRAAVLAAMLTGGFSGVALADEPVTTVHLPTLPPASQAFRLHVAVAPANPNFRIDGPDSMLHSGYAGMFDLFPFGGGAFRVSGGPRLWSRTGRFTTEQPESLRYLQPFRAGSLRASRKFRPALLVGYGHTVDQGLSLGVDAGLVKGKITTGPDRLGRLNRSRLEEMGGRALRSGMNPMMRMTALYRF